MLDNYKYIGAAVGGHARQHGCELAPEVIRTQIVELQDNWYRTIHESDHGVVSEVDAFIAFSNALATATDEVISAGHKFITFGGDHSCAIGVWSAVAKHYSDYGLIWIDAHLDAHTHDTSHTGNIHGMPVAALLGHGIEELRHVYFSAAKLKPENIVFIGIRSYEEEEKALLESLGVKIFYMDEVAAIGFQACMDYAVELFKAKNIPYGISLDLDGLDPKHITATGTAVADGIDLDNLTAAFVKLEQQDIIGIDIVEYNPLLDTQDYQDLATVRRVLDSLLPSVEST